jgi:NADH-quinone oxidoreductase subunit H
MHNTLKLIFQVLIFPGGLFVLTLGLCLKGLERRTRARLQRRVGPPLLQPFFDLAKLARKDTTIPIDAPAALFRALPWAGVCSMAIAAAMIPIPGLYLAPGGLGDLLVLFYLLTIPAIVLMLAGSASGSPFGAIAFSRELSIMMAYELPILMVLLSVAVRVGVAEGGWIELSLNSIVAYQRVHGSFLFDPLMWPALLAFLLFFPANLGLAPFDIPEAESEVLEGPLLEYSGPLLGLFKMMSAMKAGVVVGLGIVLFYPSAPHGLLGLLCFILKSFVISSVGVAILRTSMGRMRIDQAFRFLLLWPTIFSLASLLAVLWRYRGGI